MDRSQEYRWHWLRTTALQQRGVWPCSRDTVTGTFSMRSRSLAKAAVFSFVRRKRRRSCRSLQAKPHPQAFKSHCRRHANDLRKQTSTARPGTSRRGIRLGSPPSDELALLRLPDERTRGCIFRHGCFRNLRNRPEQFAPSTQNNLLSPRRICTR
jgi:hypothetical protein